VTCGASTITLRDRAMRLLLPLSMIALMLNGCYAARINSRAARGETYNYAGASLLWGLTSTETDANECPNGMAYAATYFPWWGYFVAGITVGIIVPIRKEYTCVATPQTIQVPVPVPVPLPH
jgi:hypothetical protein